MDLTNLNEEEIQLLYEYSESEIMKLSDYALKEHQKILSLHVKLAKQFGLTIVDITDDLLKARNILINQLKLLEVDLSRSKYDKAFDLVWGEL